MSWSKFLANSPLIIKTTDLSQLRSSMKKKSLRLDESTNNCFLKCTTEEEEKRVSFKEDENSCLSEISSRPLTIKSRTSNALK